MTHLIIRKSKILLYFTEMKETTKKIILLPILGNFFFLIFADITPLFPDRIWKRFTTTTIYELKS